MYIIFYIQGRRAALIDFSGPKKFCKSVPDEAYQEMDSLPKYEMENSTYTDFDTV